MAHASLCPVSPSFPTSFQASCTQFDGPPFPTNGQHCGSDRLILSSRLSNPTIVTRIRTSTCGPRRKPGTSCALSHAGRSRQHEVGRLKAGRPQRRISKGEVRCRSGGEGGSQVTSFSPTRSSVGTGQRRDVSSVSQMLAEGLEEGAMRAIQKAERECREAAQKLLDARTRLESAQMIAAELKSSTVTITVEPACAAATGTGLAQGFEVHGEDNSWRDGASVMEALVEAEMQRRTRSAAFERTRDELKSRLQDAPTQALLNDRHIEMLDRGGQYQVASWLINEVQGFCSEEDSPNLQVEMQGYDLETLSFLHYLPFNEVQKIKATEKRQSVGVVDFWDGSSWEEVGGEGEGEEEEEVGGMWLPAVKTGVADSWPLSIERAEGKNLLGVRDGQLAYYEGDSCTLELASGWQMATAVLPRKHEGPMIDAYLAQKDARKPAGLASGRNVGGVGKAALYLLACVSLTVMMTRASEVSALAIDVAVIASMASAAYAASTLVEIVPTSAMPPPLARAIVALKGVVGGGWREMPRDGGRGMSQRAWGQVVFEMGIMASVLSTATVFALVSKLALLASSTAFASVVHVVRKPSVVKVWTRLACKKFTACAAYLLTSRIVYDTISAASWGVAWVLFFFSIGMAVTSVSLILVSGSDRRKLPRESGERKELEECLKFAYKQRMARGVMLLGPYFSEVFSKCRDWPKTL